MAREFVTLTQTGPVALVTLRRPPVNALSTDMLLELQQVVRSVVAAPDCRAVVITGDGKAFVGGADIVEMQQMDPPRAHAYARLGQAVFQAIEELPQPTIAAVNGYALGGGCELAMACDLRLASERAAFGLPEVGLGVLPGFGGTRRLPRLVGPASAAELIFTGALIQASDALSLGLVNRVLAAEALLPEALQLGNLIATKAPIAVRLAKQALRAGRRADPGDGLDQEAALLARCFGTEDQKEGMEAFLQKRKPEFKNR
ncbi:MAG: enoyl-CoA hydratase-related protein [Candidatus Methylomirabilales bacterium]